MKLAEAYGIRGVRVTTEGALEKSVGEALAEERSTLIEMPVGRMTAPKFFPKPTVTKPLADRPNPG